MPKPARFVHPFQWTPTCGGQTDRYRAIDSTRASIAQLGLKIGIQRAPVKWKVASYAAVWQDNGHHLGRLLLPLVVIQLLTHRRRWAQNFTMEGLQSNQKFTQQQTNATDANETDNCEVCLVAQREPRIALVPCGHQQFLRLTEVFSSLYIIHLYLYISRSVSRFPCEIWSRVFQSCVFHPCDLVPRFPFPRFQRPLTCMTVKSPFTQLYFTTKCDSKKQNKDRT